MHGRATRTRAWCGHVHAHGKDMHMRVATDRAGILLAIMRPGQLKTICAELQRNIGVVRKSETMSVFTMASKNSDSEKN